MSTEKNTTFSEIVNFTGLQKNNIIYNNSFFNNLLFFTFLAVRTYQIKYRFSLILEKDGLHHFETRIIN